LVEARKVSKVTSGQLHPATAQVLRWFDSTHLPLGLAVVVNNCRDLAVDMAETFPDGGPELTAGLRHLLEAKDCFVRAAITQQEAGDARVRAEFEADREDSEPSVRLAE
jgi:hypothetical protein